jgi:hypothetical protein
MRLKILFLFIFFSLGFGISSSAQVQLKALPGPPLNTLTIDTLNLMVKVLDSISPELFQALEIKGGYMELFWSEECRLEIIAGGNPEIAHKIISVNIHSWDTKLKYPITKGWIGNVVVYRTRIDVPPFVLYSLEYICRPGEFFINSHALHFH